MKGVQGKGKVLIVDDTPENLDILIEALEDRYEVVAARDGDKALRIVYGPNPPDIVLLDIMMPGLDGYQVCDYMQADPVSREIPVIFLTALSDEESELRGLMSGAVDYICKPISMPLVQARVETHLKLVRAQRQLAEQVQELLEAAKLRDDVDRIMRHDLKSPLVPVIGFSNLLRSAADLTEKHRHYLDIIHSSGVMMLEMINLSLDLFKMENGTYDYQPVNLDLSNIITSVMDDMADLANRRQISMTLRDKGVMALGDELLCYSMLSNLIKNAIEAAPTKSVITINLAIEGDWGTICIHNLGRVPKEIQDIFFDKYSTAGKTGGTGIGTYSARLMAETMRGQIQMASSDADGTRITVRLLVVESASQSTMGEERV